MAISDNLTFGHGLDDKLDEIHDSMPDAFQEDPVAIVAALLTLDEMFRLRREDDYVLVAPGYAMWLIDMVTLVDPDVAAAMDDENEETFERLAVAQPFEVDFSSPEDASYNDSYPEIVRGKRIKLRIMKDGLAEELGAMCTVRANGDVIYLPQNRGVVNINDI